LGEEKNINLRECMIYCTGELYLPQHHDDLTKRRSTGGRSRTYRKRRKREIGSDPLEATLAERRYIVVRTRGGGRKMKLMSDGYANVYNPAQKKTVRAEILKVESNPSNRDYDRRGVITKGAIIITKLGRAKVTSRPGQESIINAVLIES
jgi:small subunit ribosomal protein S8e